MKFPIYASAGILLTLASLGSASTASAASATGHGLTAGPPKYYVETGVNPHGASEVPERRASHGYRSDHRQCPLPVAPGPGRDEWRPPAHQTFFIDCVKFANDLNSTVTRIADLPVPRHGRWPGRPATRGCRAGISKTEPLQHGRFRERSRTGRSTFLPKLARRKTIVIKAKTGAHAIWRDGVMPSGEIFHGWAAVADRERKGTGCLRRGLLPEGQQRPAPASRRARRCEW